MKRSKFDLIISILITIDLIFFTLFVFDSNSRLYLKLAIDIFLFNSVLIIFHLIKNITLKKQPKIIKFDLSINDYTKISESLINDGFTLGIDEIKEDIRIKHYKKEFNKDSLFMISIIECNLLDQTSYKKINSSIINQCKREKNHNIKYLYSIAIIIAYKSSDSFIKSIKIECENNKTLLMCGISKEENKLYIMEKDMKENIIKYHTVKEKLFEILNIKGSEKE